MVKSKTLRVKVWGENACFTRPEMKVERVSYDVMTPSAARGILEAILWKPAISWRIERIDVLNEIRWQSVRRNELGSKIPFSNVTKAMKDGKGSLALYIEEERQQRAGLFLRDVAYVIHAHFSFSDKKGPADNIKKFEEMFERRVSKGQCHHFPVMGNREFPAFFAPADDGERPHPVDRDLGFILYDMEFGVWDENSSDYESARPRFFRARLESGSMVVPAWDSAEVLG